MFIATAASGPSTGFEVIVPGHQAVALSATLIPLAGVPTSFETSLRGLFSFRFLPVVSPQGRVHR